MTKEDFNWRVLGLDTGAICYCQTEPTCKRHRAFAEFGRALVSQAYEEAAKIADGYDMPSSPRTEGEQVAHDIARRIRALSVVKHEGHEE